VSKYSALHLPDHIKNDLSYKHGDFKEALEETFMSFDKSLRTPEVIKELNKILDNKTGEGDHGSLKIIHTKKLLKCKIIPSLKELTYLIF